MIPNMCDNLSLQVYNPRKFIAIKGSDLEFSLLESIAGVPILGQLGGNSVHEGGKGLSP